MCQMKVFLIKAEGREKIMENVTQLELTETGIRISTLFEDPLLIPDALLKSINFLEGEVLLTPAG